MRLFNPAKLTLADALLAAGVTIKDLRGKVGHGLTITVNGQLRIIRGTFGKPAQVLVGDTPVELDSPIKHRDHITIAPAEDGQPGRATVGEVVGDLRTFQIVVNGEPVTVPPVMTLGGQPVVDRHRLLVDNDSLVCYERNTVGQALQMLGYEDVDHWRTYRITVDGAVRVLNWARYRMTVNGRPADAETPLVDGVQVECVRQLAPKVTDVLGNELSTRGMSVYINGSLVECKTKSVLAQATRNGQPCTPDDALGDGDTLTTPPPDAATLLLVDLLPYAQVESRPPAGMSRLLMTLNGKPAEFTSVIHEGDDVRVGWQ